MHLTKNYALLTKLMRLSIFRSSTPLVVSHHLQTPTTVISFNPCFLIPFNTFRNPSDITVVVPKEIYQILNIISIKHVKK